MKVEELLKDIEYKLDNKLYGSKIYASAFTEYSEGHYICDVITEIADYNIDIYYGELFEWAKGNLGYIEEANEELGAPNDIIKQIQQGQFYANEEDLYDNLQDMLLIYCYDLLMKNGIEEISDDQNDNLIMYVNRLDNNDRLPDIEEIKENAEIGEENE